MKTCKTCKIEKETTDYYKIGKNKKYISCHCKECYKARWGHRPAYYKKWLKKNPDYHKNYHKLNIKKDNSTVYAIYTPDNQVYIGQTSLLIEKRVECHRNNVGCSLYHHVIETTDYSFEDLEYEVLAEVKTKREARNIESAIIKLMKSVAPNQIINIYN